MKSLSLFLIVLYSFLSTSIVAAQTPTKEEEITGRVVAYTTNGEIQLVSSAAYFQTIILRIETKENDLAVKRYVKLDYEFIGNGTLLPKKC